MPGLRREGEGRASSSARSLRAKCQTQFVCGVSADSFAPVRAALANSNPRRATGRKLAALTSIHQVFWVRCSNLADELFKFTSNFGSICLETMMRSSEDEAHNIVCVTMKLNKVVRPEYKPDVFVVSVRVLFYFNRSYAFAHIFSVSVCVGVW